MLTVEQGKELILEETNKIENIEIKAIVLNTLNHVPQYFYEVPSSSSGKYHPEDEICEGGLVIHTLKDIKVARIMASMLNLSNLELDYVVAALILHDSVKSGNDLRLKITVFDHPLLAANLIINSNPDNKKVAKRVAKLVKSHMGRWNTSKDGSIKLPKPKTKLEKFVHMCDYIASRKDIRLEII